MIYHNNIQYRRFLPLPREKSICFKIPSTRLVSYYMAITTRSCTSITSLYATAVYYSAVQSGSIQKSHVEALEYFLNKETHFRKLLKEKYLINGLCNKFPLAIPKSNGGPSTRQFTFLLSPDHVIDLSRPNFNF